MRSSCPRVTSVIQAIEFATDNVLQMNWSVKLRSTVPSEVYCCSEFEMKSAWRLPLIRRCTRVAWHLECAKLYKQNREKQTWRIRYIAKPLRFLFLHVLTNLFSRTSRSICIDTILTRNDQWPLKCMKRLWNQASVLYRLLMLRRSHTVRSYDGLNCLEVERQTDYEIKWVWKHRANFSLWYCNV